MTDGKSNLLKIKTRGRERIIGPFLGLRETCFVTFEICNRKSVVVFYTICSGKRGKGGGGGSGYYFFFVNCHPFNFKSFHLITI